MSQNNSKKLIENLLNIADVKLNGDRAWDITVKNEQLFDRLISLGSLGLGESYMDDWWECKSLDQFFERVVGANLGKRVRGNYKILWLALKAKLFNLQKGKRAFEVGEKHYDIGNDLYTRMLGKSMTYTCGYWKNAKNLIKSPEHSESDRIHNENVAKALDEAQEAKLDLVCKKLKLKKGDRVLDIGCGWGSFARHAVQNYGAEVVGVTVSKEQLVLAKELCAGLPVEFRLQDYREVNEKFDHIVSLGMFEHVGVKNYKTYMKVVSRCLKDGGLFLLHTIGSNRPNNAPDPWIERYIFTNSIIPTAKQVVKATEGRFIIEDWHNFGADYDKTLMAWYANFEAAWPELKTKYDERFYRMWKYFLLACAGAFRVRHNQLWQIVLSKNGVAGGYESIR